MLLAIASLTQRSVVSWEAVEEVWEAEERLFVASHAAQKAFQARVAHQTVRKYRPGKKSPQKMKAYIQ